MEDKLKIKNSELETTKKKNYDLTSELKSTEDTLTKANELIAEK